MEQRTLLATFLVENINNSGEGSLRQAIFDANDLAGPDFIHFSIPGGGVQTITPNFLLPQITDPVIINATTQPGWTPNTPMVAIDGRLAGDTNGLEFKVGGNTVLGLVIHSFKFDGIVLAEPNIPSATGGNTIQFNFIGTDATGTVRRPNRVGLHLVGSPNNVIKLNLISGNSSSGIEMDFAESTGNIVQANNIGGDVTGLNPLGNGLNGIYVGAPDVPFLREHPEADVTYASGNLIGGLDLDLGNLEPLGNLIVGNAHAGVYIFRGGQNQVQGNYIGISGNGTLAIPNGTAGINAAFGADGIFIEEGHDNEIGGVAPGAGNVISANTGAGVRISAVRRAASENVIQGNRIGTDGTGHFQEGLGNQTNGIEITNTTADISGDVSAITFIGGDDELDGEQDGAVGARNIISGNGGDGILAAGQFLATVIQGNYIGVDIDGLLAAPNGRDGIRLTAFAGQDADSSMTFIGSLDPERHETGNLISANAGDGIFIGFGAKAMVLRNAIGTNKDLSAGLGNGRNGITINDSNGNMIGVRTIVEGIPVSLGNVISANVADGITIGGGSTNNHLIGNLIGIDKDQSDKLGNGRHGVSIFDSPGNHIGDATATGRNIIVNSKQFGLLIAGADSRLNTVRGNYIGVNLDGTTPRGNQTAGVVLLNATDNTIGGTAGERNLISANKGPGVQIENGNLNKVLGNSIGSDVIGEFREDLGNFSSGVVILNSANNTIRDNQIRGNGVLIGSGVEIGGAGATGNKVEGNEITHSFLRGVHILNAASGNHIGGADLDARNLISANSDGVFIADGAHDNHVTFNLIGTDESGAVAAGSGNKQAGVVILGAHGNELRGNSIRGNATGIIISGETSRDNMVRGNRITDNAEYGVEITSGAVHNTIGGLLEMDRNLISKNKEGVRIESLARENVVTDNFIGTDGTGAFNEETGNSVAGVVIHNAHENQVARNTIRGNNVGISISGADAKRNLIDQNTITNSTLRGIHLLDGADNNSIGLVLGNLISANPDGVLIEKGAHDNLVSGNRIGANEAGAFQEGFGNTGNGIVILDARLNTVQRNIVRGSGGGVVIIGGEGNIVRDNTITNNRDEGILLGTGAVNNLIGGRTVGSSNIITNNGAGIRVELSAHHNEIIDNRIGTDASGELNAALGNTGPGISILDAHHTTVESNIIRSNRTGVSISGAQSRFNLVRDNVITHSTEHGVHILENASDNPIGGVGAEDFNRISENLKSGVVVESGINNAILRNRIFGNFSLGIDLGTSGVTPNEKRRDVDAGANNLQNFPELAFATVGGSRRIVGTLSSAPGTLFVLEFFTTAQADSSGFGEAERFLTTTAVTTNSSGVASFDLFLPDGEVAGTSLTATATDPNGNTSEYAKTIRLETDTDGDGIPDRLESDAPNSGDGNQDGIPDSQQPRVASFLSAATSSYVTLALPASAPPGVSLSGVRPLSNPSPDDAPSESFFGLGFFDFRITGLAPGAAVAVEQILPSGMTPLSYFRYGPLPGQTAPQWYNWAFDGVTGAVINANRITLNFVDGLRGDDDLLANGTIVDPGGPGYAPAILVTNTLDTGPGSLRQAILDANSRPGFDFINFDIGQGVATITPLSNLPTITDALFIDGTSQGGFIDNPIIELNGQLFNDINATGLTVSAHDTTIRGLVINRFASAGIRMFVPNNALNNVAIEGNFIGTDVTGMLSRPNGNGIVVSSGAFHRIGGTTPERRNVISGNSRDGITLSGGFSVQIQGNFIGLAADGVGALGNGDNGVNVTNFFPTAFNLTIGGLAPGAGNVIAFNQDNGVLVLAANRQTGILSNSIHSNGALGIGRSESNSVVLNDIGTADGTGQNVQNFPVLSSARSAAGQTTISGYLNSRSNQTFRLQFFNTDVEVTGFGEGRTFLGTASVTIASNRVDFTITLPVALANGSLITATATSSSNNTSEFSRRVAVGEVLSSIITVNSADDVDDGTADAAHTSLREAIHAANNFPGPNEIRFAIGSGVRTILPLSPLPAIVERVTIDGTTQPGFVGAPVIEVNGANVLPGLPLNTPNVTVPALRGLAIHASNTVVRGLAINGFGRIATDGKGVQFPFGGVGIDVFSIVAESSFGGVVIEGNYIGTDVTGTLARPNFGGVSVENGNNHRIGGTTTAQRNVISGNSGEFSASSSQNGISLHNGDSHLIQGNYIGVAADGVTALGNGGNGIGINIHGGGNVSRAIVGGLAAGEGNVIAFNGLQGIQTRQPLGRNAILSNSIHSNFLLGISYFLEGVVVLNERPASQGGVTKFPTIFSAETNGGQTSISGDLDSTPNTTFLIQFFSSAAVDPSGYGEGETLIGSADVTTDANGHVDFTITLPVAIANRRLITATATDPAGNTSQFSRRQAVGEVHTGVFVVNTANDVDDGTADATHTSLREAIHAANNHPGPDEIRFAIGTGPQTISPLTPLPAILDSIVIDGWTQPGFGGTPIIEISGALMDREQFNRPSATEFYMRAITVMANDSTVRGLVINRFFEFLVGSFNQVVRAGGFPLTVEGNNNVIEGNYIGTNVAGSVGLGNLSDPRIIGNNNRIGGTTPQQRNLFAGGRDSGVGIAGDFNIIQGNYIGTNAAGTAAIPNGRGTAFGSIAASVSGNNNLIGGAVPGAGNVISGNLGDALIVSGSGHLIQGNFIGTNAAGTGLLRNAGDGLKMSHFPAGGPGITVGGTLPGARNIISGNSWGIVTAGSDYVIQGNYIGTDITGTLDLGNNNDGIWVTGGDRIRIGGTEAGAGNLISGNNRFGILLGTSGASSGHRIEGNRIGTRADGVTALGNTSDGIAVGEGFSPSTTGTGPTGSIIGGAESGAGNIIAFNNARGVNILAGQRIGLLSNSIFSNGNLGIDLNGNGVTPNDSGDADTGDNELQNFPVLSASITDGIRISVTGTLNSRPSMTFTLQFFANTAADTTGFGEGQTFLGATTVTTDAAGNATFSLILSSPVPAGRFITATATDPLNNTSEFSLALQVVAGVIQGNLPPTAHAGGPYIIDEGSPLALSAAASTDPDGDPLTYSWDINGDGIFGDAIGVAPMLSSTQLQTLGIVNGPGAFSVRVRADDGQGNVVTSDPAALTVRNVAPIPDAGPDRMVIEGDTVSLAGAFSDPGALDTHTFQWSILAGNGQQIPNGNGSAFSFQALDNGTYTVTFTVTDSDGQSGSDSVTVTAANAPPAAMITGLAAQAFVGSAVNLSASATDPSPIDLSAGFTFEWKVVLDDAPVAFGAARDFSFIPTVAGTYFIDLRVFDKDLGSFLVTASQVVAAVPNFAPIVTLAPAASLNEGGPYIVTGSFADPDASTHWTATVDFGDGAGPQPLLLKPGKTFDLNHNYVDNGLFDLVVTVTDNAGLSGSQTTRITVNNVDPLVMLATPIPRTLGQTFTLAGSFSDPGADTWTAVVDYGDGTGAIPLLLAPDKAFALSRLYSSHGSFSVTVTITDDDGGIGSATAIAVVVPPSNAAPAITSLMLSAATINEGGVVTLTGAYADPDAPDTHTITIQWGDGTSTPAAIDPANRTFIASRLFADDNPNATPADLYSITAIITDAGGLSDSDTTSLTVNNVGPALGDVTATASGRNVALRGTIADPGINDTFTLFVDWGDGSSPQIFPYPAGSTQFAESHLYPAAATANTYTLALRLLDDDGGEALAQATVIIEGSSNSAPSVETLTLSAASINEGSSITVTGTYNDPDPLDLHIVTIGWGDGTSTTAVVNPANRTFTASRGFRDDDPTGTTADLYAITATVSDAGGLADSRTALLTVNNVAPVLQTASASCDCGLAAGRMLDIRHSFTDAGTLDTHTASIDWGDGAISLATLTQSAGSGAIAASHAYETPGIYVVTITLRDDDGGVTTSTFRTAVTGVIVRDGILQVIATPGDDHIHVNEAKSKSKGKSQPVYRVHADFFGRDSFRDFPAAGITHIMIFGCDGDDHLTVASDIALPIVMDGGPGDDHLNGGDRSLLIGGAGRDKLIGGKGDDILVGGSTAFDLDPAALRGVFAGTSILNASTLFDDRERDVLVGGAGRNLIFDT